MIHPFTGKIVYRVTKVGVVSVVAVHRKAQIGNICTNVMIVTSTISSKTLMQ